jgi:magnesium-transporting ATPase (P-type)
LQKKLVFFEVFYRLFCLFMEGKRNMKRFAFGLFVFSIAGLLVFSLMNIFAGERSLPDGLILIAALALFLSSGVLWFVERGAASPSSDSNRREKIFLSARVVFRVLAVLIAVVWLFVFAFWLYSSVLAPSDEDKITNALEGSGIEF